MEEVGLLRDDADRAAQRRERDPPDVDPVDLDGAPVDVVEPRDQVGRRGLAGARRPDERDQLTRLGLEVDLLEREGTKGGAGSRAGRAPRAVRGRHRPPAVALRPRAPPRDRSTAAYLVERPRPPGAAADASCGAAAVPRAPGPPWAPRARRGHRAGRVAEPDPVEAHPSPEARGLERHGVGRVDDLGVEVQVLEDPVEERERAVDLHLHVEELARGGRRGDSGAS